jgi:valyl-tRNA synthetase
LLTGGTPGNDLNLGERQIEYGRNFGNKLWQIARFVLTNLGDQYAPQALPAPEALDLPSRWILSRLNKLIGNVQRLFDHYQYGEAGRQIRDFLWDEFADWYVENSKNALYGDDPAAQAQTRAVLLHALDNALRLLHPYMPFITEEIWSYLPDKRADQPLIMARWCAVDERYLDETAEAHMDVLRDLIVKVRNVRAEYKVEPAKRLSAIADGGSFMPILAAHGEMFSRLCNVERLEPLSGAAPDQAAIVVSGEVTLYLPLAGLVDLSAERERLTKELANLSAQIERTEKTLANEQFVSRAKPEVVAKERAKLAELRQAYAAVQERLAALE